MHFLFRNAQKDTLCSGIRSWWWLRTFVKMVKTYTLKRWVLWHVKYSSIFKKKAFIIVGLGVKCTVFKVSPDLSFLFTTLSSPYLWSCHFLDLKSSPPSVHKSLFRSFFKNSSSSASLMELWCQSSLTSSTLSSLTRSICSYFGTNFRRWTIPWVKGFFFIFVTLHPTVPVIETTLKSDNKCILLISNLFTCAFFCCCFVLFSTRL